MGWCLGSLFLSLKKMICKLSGRKEHFFLWCDVRSCGSHFVTVREISLRNRLTPLKMAGQREGKNVGPWWNWAAKLTNSGRVLPLSFLMNEITKCPYYKWWDSCELWLKLSCVVAQLLSCVQLFETPRTAAHQVSLSFTISRSLFRFVSTELVMLSKLLILCRFPSPPALNLSQHRDLLQWVSPLHQVAKVLEL